MKFEVYPVLGISALIIGGVLFKDQLANFVPFSHLSKKELQYIGRKLSPVLRFKYEESILSESRVESSLILDIFNLLLQIEESSISQISPIQAYVIQDSEEELFLLPNGCLFITSGFLHSIARLDVLLFFILKEITLRRLDVHRQLLKKQIKYGDFRKNFYCFRNNYTGYEALFLNLFVYTKYNAELEIKTDQEVLSLLKKEFDLNSEEIAKEVTKFYIQIQKQQKDRQQKKLDEKEDEEKEEFVPTAGIKQFGENRSHFVDRHPLTSERVERMVKIGKDGSEKGKREQYEQLTKIFERWKKFEIYLLPERKFRFTQL